MPEALKIQQQLIQICKAGEFLLKKWSANDLKLLDELPAENCLQQDTRQWQPGESHATLGLRWQPCDDIFFSSKPITLSTVSKRSVLSLTARLFDPLGWFSPSTLLPKTFVQTTWLLGVDWDTPLPDDEARNWHRLEREFPCREQIQIPRWLGGRVADCHLEVHDFADASTRTYAAVVYLKTERNGRSEVRLVVARTKVTPLKQVSLPRLELFATTLLARLVAHALPLIKADKAPLHLWSDCTVTLGWIRGHPSSWTTYVANRVSDIQTSLPDIFWHHVPGRDNPADCVSRELFPSDLVSHSLWQGPLWLRTETDPWTIRGRACPH